MVVEIFTVKNGKRQPIILEQYSEQGDEFQHRLFWLKMAGEWVGHRIYDKTLKEFVKIPEDERYKYVTSQDFDKGAYLDAKKRTKI